MGTVNVNVSTTEWVDPMVKFFAIEDLPEPFTIKKQSSKESKVVAKNLDPLYMRPKVLTEAEHRVKDHYDKTTVTREDGRKVVRLPFDHSRGILGFSRGQALRRFFNLETRLMKKPETYKLYREFIQELLDLDHLEIVPFEELNMPEQECYYIPHSYVEKDSSTTKLRTVCDASCETSTKRSLNDLLLVGEKLQDDLHCHIVRFRFHQIAMTADITKMYRQVVLDKRELN